MWNRAAGAVLLASVLVMQADDDRAIRAAEDQIEQTRDQESIRLYGTTAIVFYRSKGLRATHVLVKRDGRWELVSQRAVRIQPNAAAAAVPHVDVLLRPDEAPSAQDAEQQVRRAEQDIAAATERSDADALEPLWAPEFVWIGPSGLILTRADRLAAMRSGNEKSQRYAIDQETIHVYGATAVVTFRSTITGGVINGKDVSSQRTVTNVLVRSGGRWQAVVQHSTLIEPR